MIELTEKQAEILKQGYPIRIAAPRLGGELVLVLAAAHESTEVVLQETLDDLRERGALSDLGKRSANAWAKENSY